MRRLGAPARRRFRAAVLALAQWAVLATAGVAAADGERDPALRACDAQREGGQGEAAQRCYRALIAAAPQPLLAAEAHWALGEVREANDAFRRALAAQPDSAAIRARWGRLYAQTHQLAEAEALFREALAHEPAHLEARLGLAQVLYESDEARAQQLAVEIAGDAPDNSEAQLLLARIELGSGKLESAAERLERLSSTAATASGGPPGSGPCSASSLELYALRAALDQLQEKRESPWPGRALACNPHYGGAYATPAHFLSRIRRYRESIALLERSVVVEPELWSAHTDLAVNLMRENRMDEARRQLEIAYGGDPYRAETVNLLRLLDQLGSFHTSTYPAGEKKSGDGAQGPALVLRLDPKEHAVLEPYARALVARGAAHFGQRYGFALRAPVVVEMYPNHDDFAVRTAGIPGLGILGATFGYVLAMDSPSSRRPEEGFLWGSVLWHELAHVFTLEATEHRVPRWFSEGISMYEEWDSGPAPQRFLSEPFLSALREGKLLPVVNLDDGFARPSDPGQVAVSYLQAGLLCEYVASEWGAERLRSILQGFGRGLDTAAALRGALGRAPEQVDAGFLEFARRRAGARLVRGEEWGEAKRSARAELEAGHLDAAIAAAQRALALEPDDVGLGSAYAVLARARESRGELDAAVEELAEYERRGGREPALLDLLARGLADRGRRREAIDVLAQLRYVEPMDEALHQRLGDWLLAEGRAEQAREEFAVWLALDPHDRTAAQYALARAYRDLGRTEEARAELLDALERTPLFRPAQRLLLELSEGPGKRSRSGSEAERHENE